MTSDNQLVSLRLYCTCGAYRRGELPQRAARLIIDGWNKQHTGEGHALCEPKVAGRLTDE